VLSDPLNVRQLAIADLEALFSIDVSRQQTARYVARASQQPPGLLLHRQELASPVSKTTWGRNECEARRKVWRQNMDEGASIWGAYADAVLAAFVLHGPLLPNKTVEVYSLFVDASRRRAGIGSLLMGRAEEEARRLSAVALHLTTTLDNAAAIDFYLASGYQVAQLADCAIVGDQQPEIRLAKRLS
jgi:GNAT superfamily N-acetyltransferase